MSKILITGAMGVVGSELVKEYLEQTDYLVYAGVHQGVAYDKSSLWMRDIPHYERVKVVPMEINQKGLGLENQIRTELQSEVSEIIHCAGITRFDLSLTDARATNVLGTKHLLEFAIGMHKLKKIGLTSTVFVAGKRTGVIKEDELEHDEGFVNTYEQSKYEMEQLARTYFSKLPIAVYRFSTILGNSKTGMVQHFTAPHHAIRLMYLGLASMIPGKPNYMVDLIPSNAAGEIFFDLFKNSFNNGKTYHIVAGPDKSYSLRVLIDRTYEILGACDPIWAAKNFPKPTITSSKAFSLFLESAKQANNPFVISVLSALSHFAHQLDYSKTFSMHDTKERLADYDDRMPEIDDYYAKVIRYCLTTGWGKHV